MPEAPEVRGQAQAPQPVPGLLEDVEEGLMEDLRRIVDWHGPVYAGSFDPITRGHLDIVRRAVKLFGSCLVLVAHNPDKEGLFTPAERKHLVDLALEESGVGYRHLTPSAVTDGYVADLCRDCRATFLVRGLRYNSSDLKAELEIARFNRDRTGIDTVILPAAGDLDFTSSSRLKALVKAAIERPEDGSRGERAARMDEHATPAVLDAVFKKLGGRQALGGNGIK